MDSYSEYCPNNKKCEYLHISIGEDLYLCPIKNIEIDINFNFVRLSKKFYKIKILSDISIFEGWGNFKSYHKSCDDVIIFPLSKINFMKEVEEKDIKEFEWFNRTYEQALEEIEKDKKEFIDNKFFNRMLKFLKIKK